MIDLKEAVQIAKEKAVEILGAESASLEEIDRSIYNGVDAWEITLGVLRDLDQVSPLARMSMPCSVQAVFHRCPERQILGDEASRAST
jgi:hypothetical protein